MKGQIDLWVGHSFQHYYTLELQKWTDHPEGWDFGAPGDLSPNIFQLRFFLQKEHFP